MIIKASLTDASFRHSASGVTARHPEHTQYTAPAPFDKNIPTRFLISHATAYISAALTYPKLDGRRGRISIGLSLKKQS